MRPLRVFLDDVRTTPDGFVRCHWPNEVIALLETGMVEEISLDHDLGDADAALRERRPEVTGHDVLAWIEEQVVHHGYAPPTIRVHSDNAAAIARMRAGVENLPRLRERFAPSPWAYAVRVRALARGEDRCAAVAQQRGLVVVVADGAGGMPGAIVGLPARSMLFAIPLQNDADAAAMERLTRAVTTAVGASA